MHSMYWINVERSSSSTAPSLEDSIRSQHHLHSTYLFNNPQRFVCFCPTFQVPNTSEETCRKIQCTKFYFTLYSLYSPFIPCTSERSKACKSFSSSRFNSTFSKNILLFSDNLSNSSSIKGNDVEVSYWEKSESF